MSTSTLTSHTARAVKNRLHAALLELREDAEDAAFDRDVNLQEEINSFLHWQHRTHQNIFMKTVLLPLLQSYAILHRTHNHDARNQASTALAARMLDSVDDVDKIMPFI